MAAQTPPLTERQQSRLKEWLQEGVQPHCEGIPRVYELFWSVQEEIRPGRGHDVQAVYLDGDVFAYLSMDPYGNGETAYGEVDFTHSSADDECHCVECVASREAGQ